MPKYKFFPQSTWLPTNVPVLFCRWLHSWHFAEMPPNIILTLSGDYCDVYLTHDSMSVRKAHNAGRNHLRNVVEYYQRKENLQIWKSGCWLENRDWSWKGPVSHRFYHVLLRRRRSSKSDDANTRSRWLSSSTSWDAR